MAIGIPGQSRAGPVATGQAYAQSIAGGMPMEQIIAPGVSYSPEQAGGYTQADLDFIAKGPAPVMPIAPTTGEVATIPNQMPYAPPGVTQPTPFPAVGNFDFLTGLDFSNLPDFSDIDFSNIDFSNIEIDEALKEYSDRIDAGEPEPLESFFTDFSPAPVMPDAPASSGSFGITPEMIRNSIEQQKLEGIEPIYDRYIEPSIPGEPEPIVQPIAAPIAPVQTLPQNIFANIPQPVIPQPVIQKPIPQEPIEVPFIPDFSNIPMNFTGLPNMPVIPQSIAPTPVIPQIPVMPRIPQTTYIPPASSFIQPRVEEIVSPIRSGSPRNFQQPGLFNLV